MEIFINGGRNPHLTDSLYPGVITINYKKQYCTNNRYFYFKKIKQTIPTILQKDKDSSYDESKASTVKLSGSSATVSGDGVAVSGSTVTISKAGTYVISGESDGVQIKVEAGWLRWCSHRLERRYHDQHQRANFCYESRVMSTLTLADGTTNTLSDSSSNNDEDADAVIFSSTTSPSMVRVRLNIDAKKNNGIKANDTLHITGGTYKITAVGDAFNVNDELNITGTTMTIDADEDAVKVDNDEDTSVGTMYLFDNKMTTPAGDDGIHASGDLVIDKRNLWR